jgi:hypothetical protein
MYTFSDSYTVGKFNPPYANWLAEPRTLFPVPDEFLLADAIFNSPNAFNERKTPQQAYEAFDGLNLNDSGPQAASVGGRRRNLQQRG